MNARQQVGGMTKEGGYGEMERDMKARGLETEHERGRDGRRYVKA